LEVDNIFFQPLRVPKCHTHALAINFGLEILGGEGRV
jgi:hypothetical protein